MEELEQKIRAAIAEEFKRRTTSNPYDADSIEAYTQRVMLVLEGELVPHCDVIDAQGRRLYGGTPGEVRTWLFSEYKEAKELLKRHEQFEPPQPEEMIRLGSPYHKDVSIDAFLIMWA